MERNGKILVLALAVPLMMYGIPYAYASTTSSSYAVIQSGTVGPGSTSTPTAIVLQMNCNSGDYATGGGWNSGNDPPTHPISAPTKGGATISASGMTPDGWQVAFENTNGISYGVSAYVVCQTPITVAGITVPQFGSLYVAVALAAMLYFALTAVRQRRTPSILAPK